MVLSFQFTVRVPSSQTVHRRARNHRLITYAAHVIDGLDVYLRTAWGRRANATDDADGLLAGIVGQ